MAEWLCRGLQIPVQRFESASGLQRRVTRLGVDARLERALHDCTLFPLAPEPHLPRASLQGGLKAASSGADPDLAPDPPRGWRRVGCWRACGTVRETVLE